MNLPCISISYPYVSNYVLLFQVTCDLFSRTFTFRNTDGDQIAVMAKTSKAMIKEAVLGNGFESTIDIAPGVDISAILASIFGIMAVGNSRTFFALPKFFSIRKFLTLHICHSYQRCRAQFHRRAC